MKYTRQLGNEVEIDFEQSHGDTDTAVNIDGKNICWISDAEIEPFMLELEAVINKYRI